MKGEVMDLKEFLTGQIADSNETLVRLVATRLTESSLDDALITMIKAAFKVMSGLDMSEEPKLFGLLIVSRLAERGIDASEIISAGKPATAPAPAPVSVSAPVITAVPTSVSTTTVPAGPARNLNGNGKGSLFATWRAHLTGLVKGRSINPDELRKMTVNVFRQGTTQLAQADWELLFSAMKVADTKGTYIISNEVNPEKVFSSAPLDMLDEFVFGQDGFLTSVMVGLSENEKRMPSWLVAKASTCLTAVDAVDSRREDGLGEQELQRVRKLIGLLEKNDAPEKVLERAYALLGAESAVDVGSVHVPNHALAAGLAGFKITPKISVVEETSETVQ